MNIFKSISITGSAILIIINSSCAKHRSPYSNDILYSDNYSASGINTPSAFPESGKVLTLEEATRIGLANNPNIKIGQLKAIMAQAQYYGTILAAATPEVTASTSAYKNINSVSNTGSSASAITGNMTIWNGMQNEMSILAAQSQTISAEEMSLNIQRLLSKQIALVYNQIILDKAKIKVQIDEPLAKL